MWKMQFDLSLEINSDFIDDDDLVFFTLSKVSLNT
jgi:hypothetical protein